MANLYVGKTGDAVTELQNNLISLGYSGVTASGTFDTATKSAVLQFQKDSGLANPDGIYGPNTSAAMAKALANLQSQTVTTTPEAVTSGTAADTSAADSGGSTSTETAAAATTTGTVSQEPTATTSGTTSSGNTTQVINYNAQMNELYNQIMNRGTFKYDLNADDLYQQYAQQYTRLGQQAMQDTIGQAAALTGGYGNTYAQTAGQQAYQAYLQKLNDIIPDLEQNAYNRWADEGTTLQTQYSMAQSGQQDAYDKYMTMISTLGYMPSDEELASAGISADEAQLWYDYYNTPKSTYYYYSSDDDSDDSDDDSPSAASQMSTIRSIISSSGTVSSAAKRIADAYEAGEISEENATKALQMIAANGVTSKSTITGEKLTQAE